MSPRRSYDSKTRKRIRVRIAALIKTGMRREQISETLNAEGFTDPKGAPVTIDIVSRQAQSMRRNGMRVRRIGARSPQEKPRAVAKGPKRDPKTVAPVKQRMPETALSILTDQCLSDRAVRKMLLAYCDA